MRLSCMLSCGLVVMRFGFGSGLRLWIGGMMAKKRKVPKLGNRFTVSEPLVPRWGHQERHKGAGGHQQTSSDRPKRGVPVTYTRRRKHKNREEED